MNLGEYLMGLLDIGDHPHYQWCYRSPDGKHTWQPDCWICSECGETP